MKVQIGKHIWDVVLKPDVVDHASTSWTASGRANIAKLAEVRGNVRTCEYIIPRWVESIGHGSTIEEAVLDMVRNANEGVRGLR